MPSSFVTAGKILTGAGALGELGAVARSLGRRALLVSGMGSLERSGVLDIARDSLRRAGVEFGEHFGIPPEPELRHVEEVRVALERFDLAIGIGGGSVIDVAKAAAALKGSAEPAKTFQQGMDVPKGGLPCVAVPTTAGTGAEVTPNSVLTDPEGPTKASIRGPSLMPAVAIVDPEPLVHLARRQTAESGMDALVQAIESYVSVNASPLTEALSLHAMTLLARAVPAACENLGDISARKDCAYGSLAAGMALANARLGVIHGLAHPLGARLKLAHGAVCGTLLAPALRLNAGAASAKLREVERRLREAGLTGGDDAAALADDLAGRLGIPRLLPRRLTDAEIAAVIAEAMPSGSLKANPLKIEPSHLMSMLEEVMPA